MGTVAPDYSRQLHADVLLRGGQYVEAPVWGSRVPAKLVRAAAAGLDRGTWHLMTGTPYLMRLVWRSH